MSYEEQNRQALISYFQKGAKGQTSLGALGVEVEHFVVHDPSLDAVPYAEENGFGVRDVLAHLSAFYPQETRGLEGDLIGLASPEASITLEPAAQLEISIAPFASIAEVVRAYNEFREHVDGFLAEHGCKLVTQGYHPKCKARDLPLIPKQRYRFMDAYFRTIGTHGERMMRASSSTQVSVDYLDEADAIRKMRVAQALAVVLASMTDNVTRFEGEAPTAPLARLDLWRDVDNARCGSVPGLFEEGYGFAEYADWSLRTCPIFVTRAAANDPDGPWLRSVAGQSAAEAYADAPMSEEDVEHLLSMFWPDVRLKRFVEIRPADSLPIDQVAGYTALIKGLFYSEDSLSAIEAAFGVKDGVWPLDDNSTDEALQTVRSQGNAAQFSGKTLVQWQDFVLATARAALNEEDAAYLDALEQRVLSRR